MPVTAIYLVAMAFFLVSITKMKEQVLVVSFFMEA